MYKNSQKNSLIRNSKNNYIRICRFSRSKVKSTPEQLKIQKIILLKISKQSKTMINFGNAFHAIRKMILEITGVITAVIIDFRFRREYLKIRLTAECRLTNLITYLSQILNVCAIKLIFNCRKLQNSRWLSQMYKNNRLLINSIILYVQLCTQKYRNFVRK